MKAFLTSKHGRSYNKATVWMNTNDGIFTMICAAPEFAGVKMPVDFVSIERHLRSFIAGNAHLWTQQGAGAAETATPAGQQPMPAVFGEYEQATLNVKDLIDQADNMETVAGAKADAAAAGHKRQGRRRVAGEDGRAELQRPGPIYAEGARDPSTLPSILHLS